MPRTLAPAPVTHRSVVSRDRSTWARALLVAPVVATLVLSGCSGGDGTPRATVTVTVDPTDGSASAASGVTTPSASGASSPSVSGGPGAAATTSAAASAGPSAGTSAAGGPAATPAPAPSTPSGPEAAFAGARWIDSAGAFASPSGRLMCAVGADAIACSDGGPGGVRPPANEAAYCGVPADWYGINGIQIRATVGWSCGGGVPVWPVADQQRWWAGRGLPSVPVSGTAFAVLPYGYALRSGRFACVSRADGVTCRNSVTGAALVIDRDRTLFFGPQSLSAAER